MRKLLFAMAFVALTVTANAQIYLGGSIGFTTIKSDNSGYNILWELEDFRYTNFSFTPRVGYAFDDKLSVGADIMFGITTQKGKEEGPFDDEMYTIKHNDYAVSIAPFVRYNAFSFGKFQVGFEATVQYLFNAGKTTSTPSLAYYDEKRPKTNLFGVGIRPVISYNINDHFSIEAWLNFCNLAFIYSSSKQEIRDDFEGTVTTETTKTSEFNIGVSANNVATLGALQIGAVYKF